MRKTWIKICGTTNHEDAELAWSANADAIGFVLVEGSARRVTVKEVRQIVDRLARPVERIGVVADLSVEEAAAVCVDTGSSGMQLQGSEDAEYCRELRRRLPQARLIKAVQVKSADDLKERVLRLQDCGLDNILLDTHVAGQLGGTGVAFAWKQAAQALKECGNRIPIVVAGGLNAQNVGEAIRELQPFGVDVVSGVEAMKGKKDALKVREFVEMASAAKEVPA